MQAAPSTPSVPAGVELIPVRGGWMAISGPNDSLRIAVIGETREDALARFERSRAEWVRLTESDDRA